MMKNSKKLEFPEGREGVRGLESASRILMTGGSLYLAGNKKEYKDFVRFIYTTRYAQRIRYYYDEFVPRDCIQNSTNQSV